jgi:hypothetical protein
MGAALKVEDDLCDRHASVEQDFEVCRKQMRGPLAGLAASSPPDIRLQRCRRPTWRDLAFFGQLGPRPPGR